MRTVYKVLAYVVAAEVVIQAMAMVYAVAGQGKWIEEGGVLDKAVVESREFVFPEVIGYAVHGLNGMMVIPLIALLLLISSFFTKIPGATKWAGLVLLLVAIQINLGFLGHGVPAAGALHGLNALLLVTAALYTARRARATTGYGAAEPRARVTTPV